MFLSNEDVRDHEDNQKLGLEDEMPLGKFKGVKLEDYIGSNPYSLKWFVDNAIVTLTEEALEALGDELDTREDEKSYYSAGDLDPIRVEGDLPF